MAPSGLQRDPQQAPARSNRTASRREADWAPRWRQRVTWTDASRTPPYVSAYLKVRLNRNAQAPSFEVSSKDAIHLQDHQILSLNQVF